MRSYGIFGSRSGHLGILWGAYGVVRLVIALRSVLLYSGTATVMFGALLSRVPNPFALMADFHIFYVILIVWSVLSGVWRCSRLLLLSPE